MNSRIERHLRKTKTIHWHIDHITTNKSINNIKPFIIPDAEKDLEAEIANNFIDYFDAKIIVKGFGNSDTKETITHLFYKNKPIPFSKFNIFG